MFKKIILVMLLSVGILSAYEDKYLSCTITKEIDILAGKREFSLRAAKAKNLNGVPVVVKETNMIIGEEDGKVLMYIPYPFDPTRLNYKKSDRIYEIYTEITGADITIVAEYNTNNNDILIYQKNDKTNILIQARYYKCSIRSKTMKEAVSSWF